MPQAGEDILIHLTAGHPGQGDLSGARQFPILFGGDIQQSRHGRGITQTIQHADSSQPQLRRAAPGGLDHDGQNTRIASIRDRQQQKDLALWTAPVQLRRER